jgi:uncharacterized iron-regulated membrane protein
MKLRGAFVWLHRWVGLLMAGFLILVGLTGSLLAFNVELERAFAPQLFAQLRPGLAPLDLATLAERAQEQLPQAQITSVTYQEPDQVSVAFAPRNGRDGRAGPELAFDEFYVDPWTGDELGRRKRGNLSQGLINLMPFIYDLHWRLALGDIGQWTLGILAVVWTIDCFVGFYLTLPPGSKDFWRRWKPAWLIKRNASAYRVNFDLHRAGGLWFWVVLFVFAWSSVMMDIRPAYEWVMRRLFDYHDSPSIDLIINANATPHDPKIGWREALTRGQRLMAEEAKARHFVAGAPLSLSYFPPANLYLFDARGSRDLFERSPKGGSTSVTFDADSGNLIELSQPTGEHLGNTIESWLYALHMARVFGMPYRILVCVLGFVTAMLSVTGIYIWWKKRAARAGRNSAVRGSRDIHQVKASTGPSRQSNLNL